MDRCQRVSMCRAHGPKLDFEPCPMLGVPCRCELKVVGCAPGSLRRRGVNRALVIDRRADGLHDQIYFASIPAALASAVQRTISLRMKAPNSAGGMVETITPALASFSRVAGSDRNFSLSL